METSTETRLTPEPDATEPLLRMRGIVKHFPGVRALDGIDIEVRALG